ncbi:hypothetical protein OAG1_10280 [Agarivorans sp. OAG1]|uniref:hypothetical protein n=1 Tax=Agarivorans sp. OAG1 TaxID=3082387 RepID=UPI002B2ACDC3|nr:hypothetical protein OAG1_10280 [Agarivorans sp. OAG1]
MNRLTLVLLLLIPVLLSISIASQLHKGVALNSSLFSSQTDLPESHNTHPILASKDNS